ncbi:MAG: hypothetical protein ACYTFT_15690, partial [Planctomycetota bacterium]
MALPMDNETLTKELKAAAKLGRNFVFSPGKKPGESHFVLSKKKIPASERKAAKASTKGKVYHGSCFKRGPALVFETPLKVSPALTLKLKKTIKTMTNFPAASAEIRHNPDWVPGDFGDADEKTAVDGKEALAKRAEARKKVTKAIARSQRALATLAARPGVSAEHTGRLKKYLAGAVRHVKAGSHEKAAGTLATFKTAFAAVATH